MQIDSRTALMGHCYRKILDSFWNSWRSKFGKLQAASVVDGCSDDKNIADRFATVFSSDCVPNSLERHEQHGNNLTVFLHSI